MAKLFSFLFLLLFSCFAFAQDIQTTKGDVEHSFTGLNGPDALLYDQTTSVGTGTIASQQFGDFPTYSCQAADDFVVPSPGWDVQQVVAVGLAGTQPFTSALVEFYADNGTLPGTVVATQTATITDVSGLLTATLSPSVVLTAGTYWVSVSVVGDFATYGQWFWYTHVSNNNDIWCWQNPGNGFGTGAVTYTPHNVAFPGSYTDNDLSFALYGDVVPVELTSFTATANQGVVELSWITATETNNQGFEVQRNSGNGFESIGFVNGYGTTTETQIYSYTDQDVEVGTYSYRLKQVDFDGTFEYSKVVEVEVSPPAEFSLAQNFPNPFNPSTQIEFSLAADAKVTLTVYSLLGEAVATLVNNSYTAGTHTINFDAEGLNSGVYFYRIDAQGTNGESFTQVRKMMLTK